MRCVICNIFKLTPINKMNDNMRYRYKNINYIKDNMRCFKSIILQSIILSAVRMHIVSDDEPCSCGSNCSFQAAIRVMLKKALQLLDKYRLKGILCQTPT